MGDKKNQLYKVHCMENSETKLHKMEFSGLHGTSSEKRTFFDSMLPSGAFSLA